MLIRSFSTSFPKSLITKQDYDSLWKQSIGNILKRGILRRIAENELEIKSERILLELIPALSFSEIEIDNFRSTLKNIERKFLSTIDNYQLQELISNWQNKYPFI